MVDIALWGHTLDQSHIGLRQVEFFGHSTMGKHTGPTSQVGIVAITLLGTPG